MSATTTATSAAQQTPAHRFMFVDSNKYAAMTGVSFLSIMKQEVIAHINSSYTHQTVITVANTCEILYMGFEVEDVRDFRPFAFIAFRLERKTRPALYEAGKATSSSGGPAEVEKISVHIEMCFTLPRMKVTVDTTTDTSQLELYPILAAGQEAPVTPARPIVDGTLIHLYLPGGSGGGIVAKMIERFIRREVHYRSSISDFTLNYRDRSTFKWLYGAGISNDFDETPEVAGTNRLMIYNNIFNSNPIVAHDGIIEELPAASPSVLTEERSFFESSPAYLEINAGPLTKAFLRKLRQVVDDQEEYDNLVIRVSTVRLHPNQYANVPGLHTDFPETDENGNIRIDTEIDGEAVRHFLVTSAEPTTEFIIAPNIYLLGVTKLWSNLTRSPTIESLKANPENFKSFPPGQLVEMSGNTLHRVPENTAPGLTFRYLARASRYPLGHPRRPAPGVDHATRGSVQNQTQICANINQWQ